MCERASSSRAHGSRGSGSSSTGGSSVTAAGPASEACASPPEARSRPQPRAGARHLPARVRQRADHLEASAPGLPGGGAPALHRLSPPIRFRSDVHGRAFRPIGNCVRTMEALPPMLKFVRHRLGLRVYVLRRRIHEWHLGLAVLASPPRRVHRRPRARAVARHRARRALAGREGLARPDATGRDATPGGSACTGGRCDSGRRGTWTTCRRSPRSASRSSRWSTSSRPSRRTSRGAATCSCTSSRSRSCAPRTRSPCPSRSRCSSRRTTSTGGARARFASRSC